MKHYFYLTEKDILPHSNQARKVQFKEETIITRERDPSLAQIFFIHIQSSQFLFQLHKKCLKILVTQC